MNLSQSDGPRSAPPELSFILCVYNEMARIERAMADVVNSLAYRTEPVEILVFDNGSTDGTREWLNKFSHSKVQIIFNETNLGKGGSIRKGIQMAQGRYLVFHDMDLEYTASDVWRCFDKAKTENADAVFGSRLKAGLPKTHYPINLLGVILLSKLIDFLYGIHVSDSATGMKLIRTTLAQSIRLRSTGFDLDFDILTQLARLGVDPIEIPIDYFPRTVAQGKKIRAFHDGIAALKIIFKNKFLFDPSPNRELPILINTSK